MKLSCRFAAVVCFLAVSLTAARGQAVADDPELLFRGKICIPMTARYNGTFYWDSPSFHTGTLMYNGVVYNDVLFNIDAAEQQVLVKKRASSAPLYTSREQLAWARTEDGRIFVNLRYLGYDDVPEGFFELLYDCDSPVFERIEKHLFSDTGDKNGSTIGYYDEKYDTKTLNYFAIKRLYYIIHDGRPIRLRRRHDLLKLYPEDKKAVRKFISSNNLDYGDVTLRRYFSEVTRFAEGNSGGAGLIGRTVVTWKPGGGEDVPPTMGIPETLVGGSIITGFFEPKTADQNDGGSRVIATYSNKVYVIGEGKETKGQPTISGKVTDAETGEPIPGVVIYDENTRTYARSDSRGRYKITLPAGDNVLNFSEPTKEELHLMVSLRGSGALDVRLPDKIEMLKGAIISAESMAKHRTPAMGIEKVSMKTVAKIPSAFGEGDVLKAVMTLPGVQSVGEASGGFNVRGGSEDQNLILFNEGTIYHPNHLFGLFSAFNPDIVDQVELYKSSIPAEFGGRISSVLNVTSKEGNREKLKATLGIGLLTSRFEIDGPIGKKTTFILGGRTTYSDWALNQLPKSSSYSGGSAGFSDLNLGLTHRFDEQNTLKAYAYWARDRFSFQKDTTFRYGNLNAALIWKRETAKDREFTLSAGFDGFTNHLDDFGSSLTSYTLDTGLGQAFLKAVWQIPAGDQKFRVGANLLFYGIESGTMAPYGEESNVMNRTLDNEYAPEGAVFVSDTWKISDLVSLEGGLRLSGYAALAPFKFYWAPEFRFSAKYSPEENLSFKAGFNTMTQYIHLLTNTSGISPMDTWKLSDSRIRPTTGWQAAAGAYYTLTEYGTDFSAEAYYKRSRRELDYVSGATLVMNPNIADDLVETRGQAWGIEFMARKTVGSLNGWVSYTYSRSLLQEMEDRGISTINGGDWYKAPYDKPHELKAALNYALTHRFSFSMNLDYSTGRPVTVPVGKYIYNGGTVLAYSMRNGYRIPDYFRLDLSFNIDPGHYLKAITHTMITLGVYNVTGRKNPYSIFYTTGGGGAVSGHMLSIFAMPVPYINYNLLF